MGTVVTYIAFVTPIETPRAMHLFLTFLVFWKVLLAIWILGIFIAVFVIRDNAEHLSFFVSTT
jgi:hypothetical protein